MTFRKTPTKSLKGDTVASVEHRPGSGARKRAGLFLLACSLGAAPVVKIQNLRCPASVVIGSAGVCTITITRSAPKGGMTFKVTAPGANVPALVTVPQGASSAQFQILTMKVEIK